MPDKTRPIFGLAFAAALLLAIACPPARAIIVIRDPGRNLYPPTGALKGSGWQYEGDWHGFTGTAIGPNHFITAAHVGGIPGESFTFQGKDYRTLGAIALPETDLCVWRVSGSLPLWAPLYDGHDEIGRDIVLFGRGTARGPVIRINGQPHGWHWAETDDQLSWGRSWIAGRIEPGVGSHNPLPFGDVLTAPFDQDIGPDAGCVSAGDSGGGVFLKDNDGVWKLAGVIYGVENGFSPLPDRKRMVAGALFDTRGLYRVTNTGIVSYIPPDAPDAHAAQSLISRVSTSAPAIRRAVRSTSEMHQLQRYLALIAGLSVMGILLSLLSRPLNRRLARNAGQTTPGQ